MSVNGGHVLAHFTGREWDALFRHIGDEGSRILRKGRERAKNSEVFEPEPEPACGLCLKSERHCRCSVEEARVFAFRGREDVER